MHPIRTPLNTEFGLLEGIEAAALSAAQRRGDTIVNAVTVLARARNERREVEFCIAVSGSLLQKKCVRKRFLFGLHTSCVRMRLKVRPDDRSGT